ncbi:unnamed protein product [Effrenium voratum]|uniref:Uncharacterized protein n=1 Tax=Effrenium voratum TaxID=2562239 RepID=A0AA36HPW3_9DINO|nr:unnamed protein product [Effrenium voratum]
MGARLGIHELLQDPGTWEGATCSRRPPLRLRTSFESEVAHVEREAGKDVEKLEEFLGVKSAPGTGKKQDKNIATVNQTADLGLQIIQSYKEAIPAQRKALDLAMDARMAELAPLCSKYMFRRAELQGLSAAQCVAAQGRLNAEQLDNDRGPSGCVDPRRLKSGGAWTLPAKPCTFGFSSHQMKCSTRLDYLQDREPAPGSDPDGDGHSMDEWVNKWCHPKFSVPGRPLSADLAAGEYVQNEEAEQEAEALKPEENGGDDKVPPDEPETLEDVI